MQSQLRKKNGSQRTWQTNRPNRMQNTIQGYQNTSTRHAKQLPYSSILHQPSLLTIYTRLKSSQFLKPASAKNGSSANGSAPASPDEDVEVELCPPPAPEAALPPPQLHWLPITKISATIPLLERKAAIESFGAELDLPPIAVVFPPTV